MNNTRGNEFARSCYSFRLFADQRSKEWEEPRLILNGVVQSLRLSCVHLMQDSRPHPCFHQRVPGKKSRDDNRGDRDTEQPEKQIVLGVHRADREKNRHTDVDQSAESQLGLSAHSDIKRLVTIDRDPVHGMICVNLVQTSMMGLKSAHTLLILIFRGRGSVQVAHIRGVGSRCTANSHPE